LKNKELETIEGAQEFLQEIQAPLKDMDSKIKKLKEKIKEVEKEMDSFDPLTVEGIMGSMEKRVLIENLEEGVKKAEAEKHWIIESNFDATFKRAKEILNTYSSKVLKAYHEENKLILRKVSEIRAIYEDLKRDQFEAERIVRDLRVEIQPYLKPKKEGDIDNIDLELTVFSRVNIFDKAVDEKQTGAKGLKPNMY